MLTVWVLVQIFNDKQHVPNLYTDNIEVDYRNYEVTLDSIVRVLTDRHPPGTARSRRLLSDSNSNVLIYITGHGGNQFMKIQVLQIHLILFDKLALPLFMYF
jgi:GPI-anchor transamidase subunit K